MQLTTWTKYQIQELLRTNDDMVCRSLVKLYEMQTEDEKAVSSTTHHNGRGFNQVDARFLTSLAESYLKNEFLSMRQLNIVRQKLFKYAGQLTPIANNS